MLSRTVSSQSGTIRAGGLAVVSFISMDAFSFIHAPPSDLKKCVLPVLHIDSTNTRSASVVISRDCSCHFPRFAQNAAADFTGAVLAGGAKLDLVRHCQWARSPCGHDSSFLLSSGLSATPSLRVKRVDPCPLDFMRHGRHAALRDLWMTYRAHFRLPRCRCGPER